MAYSFLDGNEAIARAAVASGCRFYAAYPITPASSISDWMLKLLPPSEGIVLQGEDEIAAIGYCLGAAMTGKKVMTATSGPGISLYSEQISFAIGSEIPIVIVNVQRLGPSTGSPTLGADGDIEFMRWGNSGGLPVIVLSPSDVIDCYVLTFHAFNLSERYRCPVFIASNKEVGTTRENVDIHTISPPKIEARRLASPMHPYLPFGVEPGAVVPDFLPIGGKVPVRQTSSTHGPDGYITNNSFLISECRSRLNRKLSTAFSDASLFDYLAMSGAETLIISYGVTSRAAKAACAALLKEGLAVSLLTLKILFPVPTEILRRLSKNVRRVIVLEMNLGQYVREVERILPEKRIIFFGQMNGELITPAQIKEVVADAIASE